MREPASRRLESARRASSWLSGRGWRRTAREGTGEAIMRGMTAHGEPSGRTLFLPHAEALAARRPHAGESLPPELRAHATRRLRLIAIIYSLAFFFADLVPPLLMGHLGQKFQIPSEWVPTVASIAGGLA